MCSEPCTLYRAADVQNAREHVRRHAWAKGILDGWRRSVQVVMEQDRTSVDAMVSDLTNWPTYGQNCPVCVGKQSSMGECGIYKWSPGDPDRVVCKYCGTVYPNAGFPETGVLACSRMDQRFTYYETEGERAHPEDRSGKHAFRWASWPVHTSWSGVIRSMKSSWCASKALPLAKLYAITGEVAYAERCAWILDRLARAYPHWLFHSYNGTFADCPPAEAAANLGTHGRGGRFPKDFIVNAFGLHRQGEYATLCNGFWGAGRFSCSGSDGGFLLDCTIAYDLIRDATFPDGRPVLPPEAEKRLVEDLILAGCIDTENWGDINNKCGPGRALSAAVGMLFGRPASVRRALSGFETLMERCFHVDGFCKESPSYSGMHLGLMQRIPEILRGYSDPVGFEPSQGKRLEGFDPFGHVGRYRLALESMVRMLAPDGRYPVIGDTHCGAGLSSRYAEVLACRYGQQYAGLLETVQKASLDQGGSEYSLWYRDPAMQADAGERLPLRTEWFPGWHVGVLRGGDPLGETALFLNAYQYHGHRHHDTLGIIYYAYGREIASDRGYIWDDPRNAWTKSSMAHNLVVVDGGDQKRAGRRSALRLFGAAPAVEVVEAEANAYDQCEQYRRTCALIRTSEGGTYAVDVFRVKGGAKHQYCFQCNGSLSALDAPALEPAPDRIKWLSAIRMSQPAAGFRGTWTCGDVGMDLIMLSSIDRLLVADAPGWRSDKGSQANAPPIQQILAERTAGGNGETAADSTFVALMVPHTGTSPVVSGRMLVPGTDTKAVGVAIELGDRTDYVLSAPDEVRRQYGPVTLAGRFAFVSVARDGRVLQAYLLAGTELVCGATSLRLPQALTPLPVADVRERVFVLREPLDNGLHATGSTILAGDTGYEIESVAGRSVTVRDYPGISCGNVTLVHSAWMERAH